MKKALLFFLPFFTLFLSCRASVPEEIRNIAGNSIIVSLEKKEITSAENCAVLVDIQYDESLIPELPDWESLFSPVKITGIDESDGILPDGKFYRRHYRITLEHLLPGDYLLRPVSVTLLAGDNSTVTVNGEMLSLKVLSALSGGEVFIDDFVPQESRNRLFNLIPTGVVIILLAGASIYLVYRKKKKRFPPPEGISPEERIAFISEAENNREFYSRMLSALREYLDNTLFLSVQSSTTEEFIDMASRSSGLSPLEKDQIFRLMRKCDAGIFGVYDSGSCREEDLQLLGDILSSIGSRRPRGVEP